MWNLSFSPPQVIDAKVLTSMPAALRKPVMSEWAHANKPGQIVDCFLEGPSFDRSGNLYLTDIPHGRIFRVSPDLKWACVAQYEGWPNGLAIHADGSVWIADYRRGLLRLQVETGDLSTLLGHRNSESFKGLNDLTFDAAGACYFTDQGQTGMQDPTGRVYRLRHGQSDLQSLECLISNAPSPNGLALSQDGKVLFLAVTRANQIWRAPLPSAGSVSKVGVFQSFFGISGPDGMAVDRDGGLVVAHASLGGAFVINARGEITHFVRSPAGHTITNVAFRPGTSTLVLTDSSSGSVLQAALPTAGMDLYSHS
ncbi:SMP-30/gluconolactonase/LRE family protein [Noviherbaspirillum sp. L7-7A]|uniref:SMP-30/gluconolactonase/LRE family protein n=1 Tax=Noviherbaspirillum sp. L7-7A TaxID=2850560 RepID=UPI001C2C6D00|nr:SMP-30/gluconolactonase/LRE family protein [Noviherbaspirillum sp. L7-7A]MBV0881537.1 SMP-30/gluconolactonase/LRE family protein [Noviherbaspirillum sp. L7-7A]